MSEIDCITAELPPESPFGNERKIKWHRLPGTVMRALYGILVTVLASLGATVLLNPSLREFVLGAIFPQ